MEDEKVWGFTDENRRETIYSRVRLLEFVFSSGFPPTHSTIEFQRRSTALA